MFKTIVVAIDGSEPSFRALDAACALAQAFSGELHLVHALESRRGNAATDGGVSPDAPERAPNALAEAIARAASHGVTPATNTVGEGDPAEEIMTIAGLYGADLIVMGRRGLGNLKGLIAGSTSQQISRAASCGVLTVK